MKKENYKKYISAGIFFLFSGLLFLSVTLYINQQIQQRYASQRKSEIKQETEYLKQNISNLILIRNRQLKSIIRAANEIIKPQDFLKISARDSLRISALTAENGELREVQVPQVTYKDQSAWANKDIPTRVRRLTNGHYNIYIRTAAGYLRLFDYERNIGEFIPEYIHPAHPAVQNIEQEKQYQERRIYQNDSRLYIYTPLYIEGNLRGIIKCGIDEGISAYLNKTFQTSENSPKNFFLITSEGQSLLNSSNAIDLEDEHLLNKLFNRRSHYSELVYSFDSPKGMQKRRIHYSYLARHKIYAGIIIPDNYFMLLGSSQKIILYSAVLLIFLILNAVFFYFMNRFHKTYESMTESTEAIAAGRPAEAKHKIPNNQAGKALLNITNYLENLTEYAISISNDKEYKHYKPAKDDLPGQALNTLKEDRNKLKERGLIKKFTAEIKKKTEEGKTKINDLLQYADDIKELSQKIVKIIYEITEVNQIGFFLVSKEGDKKFLELQAAFAYNEERFFKEKISAESSLTGRAVMEKERVFLKDLPKNYTKLATGFGETSPKTLAIIPLIFNNEVQAVIEIASLKEIQSYQMRFIEDVGEGIASTISNIKNSKQTEALLKQTEEQSKQIENQRKELQEKIETHRRQNRRIDKELNEKRELLNSIQKSAFLIELNLTGEILSINKNMLELFDVDEKQWRGKRHKDFIVCENYSEEYSGFFRDLSKDKNKYKIETISLKENVQMKFSVIYSPLRNARGRIRAVLMMAHKIDFEA